MTVRTLTPSQLPQLIPTILAGHHVVALTPATGDPQWAARAAWMAARAAAGAGRRVLLIDLGIQGADLNDSATRLAPTGGIAEAFASNGNLQDFALEQDVAGLHYAGRGAAQGNLADVWSSERWERLARGFANEGALLLLAVPPAALGSLNIAGLALVVLAQEGYTTTTLTFPAISNRVRAGTPLLGVISREARTRPSQPVRRRSGLRPRPRRSTRAIAGIAAVVVVIAAVLLIWSRGSGTEPVRALVHRERSAPPVPAPTRENPADSLYYSVQVAAHNTLSQAMTHAAEIERLGHLTVVSPARTGTQGVWYRVLVGALPTARAADSLLQTLWHDGALERPQGTILRTPDAYRLRASRDDLPGLRAQGIPAYIVLSADRADLVYVGAFDLAEQASATDSLLGSAHLAGTLVRRTGSSQ